VGAVFRKKEKLWQAWLPVLIGKATWVGYAPHPSNGQLPPLKPGIFSPLDALHDLQLDKETAGRLNFFFAKDWELARDLSIFFKA
jgi:hypothetical protein